MELVAGGEVQVVAGLEQAGLEEKEGGDQMWVAADDAELRKGLDLTGYFLERHVFWPHNKPLPAARARFMETLQR